MRITKENYESWMLSYVEGELQGKDLSDFENFLLTHPELQEEARELSTARLDPEHTFFPDKNLLKAKMLKQVIEEEEMSCFEAAEGTLDPEKRLRLDKRLTGNERLSTKLNLYQQAKLVPNTRIVFPDKTLLFPKTAAPVERNLWPYMAAAAVAAFVVFMVVPFGETSTTQKSTVAQREKPKKSITAQPIKKTYPEPSAFDSAAVSPAESNTSSVSTGEIPDSKAPVVKAPSANPMVMPSADQLIAEAKKAVSKPAKKASPGIQSDDADRVLAQIEELKRPELPKETPAPTKNQAAEKSAPRPYSPAAGAPLFANNQPRKSPAGTPNQNFVRVDTPSSPVELPTDISESALAKVASYVTGDRLTLSAASNGGTKVQFNSKLVGFTTTLK